MPRLPALLALLLVATASFTSPGRAQDRDARAIEAFQRLPAWSRSLVYIRIRCPSNQVYTGTGVIVRSTGEVLTAAHVGSACLNVTTARMGLVRSAYAAPGEEMEADLVHRVADANTSPNVQQVLGSSYRDLALWRIRNASTLNLVPAAFSPVFPVPGDEVEVVGFSGLPFSHFNNSGMNAGPGLTRFRTSLSSIAAAPATEVPYRLHYTGATLPGVSGGPVLDAQGRLLGIHSGRTTGNVTQLVQVGCTVGWDENCARAFTVTLPNNTTVTHTVGVNYLAVKSVLDNYSWATSVLAAPAGWLP